MSELQLFNGYMECIPVCATLENVVGIIRSDSQLEYRTRQQRLALQQGGDSRLATSLKSASPCIAVAVRFDEGKRREHIVGWTGLSLVDIDHWRKGRFPRCWKRFAPMHTPCWPTSPSAGGAYASCTVGDCLTGLSLSSTVGASLVGAP